MSTLLPVFTTLTFHLRGHLLQEAFSDSTLPRLSQVPRLQGHPPFTGRASGNTLASVVSGHMCQALTQRLVWETQQ